MILKRMGELRFYFRFFEDDRIDITKGILNWPCFIWERLGTTYRLHVQELMDRPSRSINSQQLFN
jgi:hypothetical protein